MGTRSRIGIKNGNGTITSIYCHWDGYPSYNGRILLENYTDKQTVLTLMKLGDISTLGRTPTRYHPNQVNQDYWSVKESVRKRERKETPDVTGDVRCMPYFLRGEKCPAFTGDHMPSEGYDYLFDDGKWYYHGYNHEGWKLLTPEAYEEE